MTRGLGEAKLPGWRCFLQTVPGDLGYALASAYHHAPDELHEGFIEEYYLKAIWRRDKVIGANPEADLLALFEAITQIIADEYRDMPARMQALAQLM